MPPEITYAYVWVNDQIRVDAAVECGKRFEGIAWIDRPNSSSPALWFDKPLGTGAVQKILDRINEGFAVAAT